MLASLENRTGSGRKSEILHCAQNDIGICEMAVGQVARSTRNKDAKAATVIHRKGDLVAPRRGRGWDLSGRDLSRNAFLRFGSAFPSGDDHVSPLEDCALKGTETAFICKQGMLAGPGAKSDSPANLGTGSLVV